MATVGCDDSEKITQLEKQNQELQVEVKRNESVVDYDLQDKCSKDATAWFNAATRPYLND